MLIIKTSPILVRPLGKIDLSATGPVNGGVQTLKNGKRKDLKPLYMKYVL
jgi:hypothetical protein